MQSALDEQALIEDYIDPGWDRFPGGPADARLRNYGASVWALIGYLRLVGGDVDRVAQDYGLSRVAVDAALAYFRQNKALIDGRIRLNAA